MSDKEQQFDDEERLLKIQEILENPDKPELAEEFFEELDEMVFKSPAFEQLFSSNTHYFRLDGHSDIIPDPISLNDIVPIGTAQEFELKKRENAAAKENEANESEKDLNSTQDSAADKLEDEPIMRAPESDDSELSPEIDTVTSSIAPKETVETELIQIADIDVAEEKGEVLESVPEKKAAPKKSKKRPKSKKLVQKETKKDVAKGIPKSVKSSDELETKFLERQKKIQDILNDGKGNISSNSV